MEQVFKESFLSVHGSSIKNVAPRFGFAWRVDDPGGAISQTYLEQLRDSTDAEVVTEATRWLLTYNEDDVAAMAVIRDGMTNWDGPCRPPSPQATPTPLGRKEVPTTNSDSAARDELQSPATKENRHG